MAACVADGGGGRWMDGVGWWHAVAAPVAAIAQQCSHWQQEREQSTLLLSCI